VVNKEEASFLHDRLFPYIQDDKNTLRVQASACLFRGEEPAKAGTQNAS